MKRLILAPTVLVLLSHFSGYGQKPPDQTRGYKVHNINVTVVNRSSNTALTDKADVLVKLSEPKISVNGLLSVAIEIGAEITALRQSGKVDFLTFSDFRINGIAVEIEEYKSGFSFKKNVPVSLPTRARAIVSIVGVAKVAYKELIESKKEWSVTGTVFVFGNFNKFGFSFKRVVPIKIDMTIKNPLTN